MSSVETVKVQNPNAKGEFMVINRSDFDEDQASDKPQYKLHKANAESDDDQPGNVAGNDGRNADGTFSEPTPTDIRYSNKLATEFADNNPAGVSAAEARDAAGMEQKPGGIIPQVHENVKAAEEALRGAVSGQTGSDARLVPQVAVEGVEDSNSDGKKKKK